MPAIPYQIIHGGRDAAVAKARHSDRLVPLLRGRGIAVEYIEAPEMGHCGPFPAIAVHRRYVDFIPEQVERLGRAGPA
jgi:dipeptidyl aminopeptidase/acylaminoacyl peptidase